MFPDGRAGDRALEEIRHVWLSLLWFAISLLCHETAFIGPLYLASVLFLIEKYSGAGCRRLFCHFDRLYDYIAGREQFVHSAGTLANMARFEMSLAEYGAAFSHLIFYLKILFFLKILSSFGPCRLPWQPVFLEYRFRFFLLFVCLS